MKKRVLVITMVIVLFYIYVYSNNNNLLIKIRFNAVGREKIMFYYFYQKGDKYTFKVMGDG